MSPYPWAAGCQSAGTFAYREARAGKPRALGGPTDLSALVHIAQQLGPNLMTFAVPLAMLEEMETNVAGSFLECDTWHSLIDKAES